MRSFISPHRGSTSEQGDQNADYLMMHPVYTKEYAESVKPQHKVPEKVRQTLTLLGQALHRSFNAANWKNLHVRQWALPALTAMSRSVTGAVVVQAKRRAA